MTAADDKREELEALLWGFRLTAQQVRAALARADAYAKAEKPPREPRGAAPAKPRAVHYAPEGAESTACRPSDRLWLTHWKATADPEAVTCGHCRETPAWADARVLAGRQDSTPGGAP